MSANDKRIGRASVCAKLLCRHDGARATSHSWWLAGPQQLACADHTQDAVLEGAPEFGTIGYGINSVPTFSRLRSPRRDERVLAMPTRRRLVMLDASTAGNWCNSRRNSFRALQIPIHHRSPHRSAKCCSMPPEVMRLNVANAMVNGFES